MIPTASENNPIRLMRFRGNTRVINEPSKLTNPISLYLGLIRLEY